MLSAVSRLGSGAADSRLVTERGPTQMGHWKQLWCSYFVHGVSLPSRAQSTVPPRAPGSTTYRLPSLLRLLLGTSNRQVGK